MGKSLGLSSLHHTIARQESRLLWLSKGDTPTRFFHVHANSRRRKNSSILFITMVRRWSQSNQSLN
jgi:hypothetical protein